MYIFAGPIAGIMVDKFGDRVTIMVGCIGCGFSAAVASIAESFEVVLISFGIAMGKFKLLDHKFSSFYLLYKILYCVTIKKFTFEQ